MKARANSGRDGFREFEHSADVGIEVTGADGPALFASDGLARFRSVASSRVRNDPITSESSKEITPER